MLSGRSPLQLPSSVFSLLSSPTPSLPSSAFLPFPSTVEPPSLRLLPRFSASQLLQATLFRPCPHLLGPLLLSFLNPVSYSSPPPHASPSFSFIFSPSCSDLSSFLLSIFLQFIHIHIGGDHEIKSRQPGKEENTSKHNSKNQRFTELICNGQKMQASKGRGQTSRLKG